MSTDTLLLIDGTGVAYRAFYAIKELSTKSGRPTNAVFGFIKMLRQLEQLWKPTHWAVVFDGGVPEERLARLATYKAQRAPMPDPLREQFAPIEDYLARSGVPSIRMLGQEADDVMATIVEQSGPRSVEVLMASSDKDLFQLVGERVVMVAPSKAGEKMGPAEVFAKTGVWPAMIVEWLALTGDNVDNIPGVSGVGPKTAAELLARFGSLDNLWKDLGSIAKPKLREALEAHRAEVLRNVELIRLRRDLPVGMDWEAARVRPPDAARLLPFLREMEFGSLARALEEEKDQGPMLNFS
ncbi:MAG: 5'-3' exonuclease H3TH domain-containing protein [Verrucomicrobiota bacterium]